MGLPANTLTFLPSTPAGGPGATKKNTQQQFDILAFIMPRENWIQSSDYSISFYNTDYVMYRLKRFFEYFMIMGLLSAPGPNKHVPQYGAVAMSTMLFLSSASKKIRLITTNEKVIPRTSVIKTIQTDPRGMKTETFNPHFKLKRSHKSAEETYKDLITLQTQFGDNAFRVYYTIVPKGTLDNNKKIDLRHRFVTKNYHEAIKLQQQIEKTAMGQHYFARLKLPGSIDIDSLTPGQLKILYDLDELICRLEQAKGFWAQMLVKVKQLFKQETINIIDNLSTNTAEKIAKSGLPVFVFRDELHTLLQFAQQGLNNNKLVKLMADTYKQLPSPINTISTPKSLNHETTPKHGSMSMTKAAAAAA